MEHTVDRMSKVTFFFQIRPNDFSILSTAEEAHKETADPCTGPPVAPHKWIRVESLSSDNYFQEIKYCVKI